MHPVEERRRRPHIEERRRHAPIEERIESRLPPCPLRIQCESQSLILPSPLSPCPPPPPWCRNHGTAAELECRRGLVEGQERRSLVALIAASLPRTRALSA